MNFFNAEGPNEHFWGQALTQMLLYPRRRLRRTGIKAGSALMKNKITAELGLLVIWKLVSHSTARVGRGVQERNVRESQGTPLVSPFLVPRHVPFWG